VTALAPGCTTSQIGCSGGGCCNVGFSCTEVSNTGYCAPATVAPTASGISETSPSGLSQGAKAGIGAGVAIGACLIIGVLTYFCIRRRRAEQSRRASSVGERTARGPVSAFSPGASGAVPQMSENASDLASRGGGPRGLTTDYFGPAAVEGPFTETARDASRGTTPNIDRGVPLDPQHPDHIQAPVEIDSRAAGRAASWTTSHQRSPLSQEQASEQNLVPSPEQSETQSTPFFTPATQGRFELYGSGMASPSPPRGLTPSPHEETRHEAEG
jgi:hypothetical protein